MNGSPPSVAALADQPARDLAVSEFVRPVVLEAGAGTGKTRALVARLATWLLGPGWAAAAAELEERRSLAGAPSVELSEVAARVAEGTVAITFTEAAAAEMAHRLGELLGQLAGGQTAKDLDPQPALLAGLDLAGRANGLVAVLSRLRLQTIHGFCHRLLADHPFEAGLHPTLAVDADGSAVAATATEVVLAALRGRQAPVAALVREGISPSELHAALMQLIAGGARREDLARDPFDDPACSAILSGVAADLGAFLPELDRLAASAKRMKTLPRAFAALRRLADGLEVAVSTGRAELLTFADQVRDSSPEWEELLERYAKGVLKETESGALGTGGASYLDLARSAHDRLVEVRALDLRRFELSRQALGPLIEQVRYRLERAGVLTFDDLLDRATALLQRNTVVRRRLRREIRQLLVDEFQDTDRRQCDLLAALALGADEGPRPGLFIVGDPKQSIYAWRRADLASYENFLESMAAAGGESARLSVNFRSVPAVLEEVERSVAPVMVAEPGVQPRFEPLTASPARAASPGFRRRDRHPVEYWLSWDPTALPHPDSTKADPANLVEAAAIAADIRELHDAEGIAWGSFAILLKARGALEVYLEALRRAGVPYAVQKDRSYYRRREIIDLACAVRALLDPADLLALVAFLRSPLVGVPDAAWIPLWRAGFAKAMADLAGPQDIAAVDRTIASATAGIPTSIPGLETLVEWPLALGEAVRAVAHLREDFRRLPAAAWIERLRAWLLPEPLAAARFLGRFGLANVERLLTRLERELDEESDPLRALARLRQAVEEEKEAEDARPPDAGTDAVAVMTIHAAKGLQFDQVYLAQIQRGNRGNDAAENDVLDGVAGHGRELRLFGAPSPGYLAADRHRRRLRDAEAVRLLYVATTRARDRLVICGNWNESPQPLDLGRAKTFLDLLAGRHPGNLTELGSGAEVVDAAGVPWRFAARWRTSTPQTSASDRPPEAASAAGQTRAIGAPAAVPPGQRVEARERAGRPRIASAAGLAGVGPKSPETPSYAESGTAEGHISRPLARALGVALHRALEFEEGAEQAPEAWLAAADSAFVGELPGASDVERKALVGELARLRASRLFAELRSLRPSVLAREMSLLVGATGATGATEATGAEALDGIVGTLDLLYRDPKSGETVIADFKTDEIAADEVASTIAAKVIRYRPQLELYGRAVATALALDRPPRLELWFMAVDRIEVVGALTAPAASL